MGKICTRKETKMHRGMREIFAYGLPSESPVHLEPSHLGTRSRRIGSSRPSLAVERGYEYKLSSRRPYLKNKTM